MCTTLYQSYIHTYLYICIIGTEARQYITELMKEELGLDFDDVFESFDDTPLGRQL